MKQFYQFIFDRAGGWWGKLAASMLIGWILGAKGAHSAGDPWVSSHWQQFGFGGAVVGLVGALFLVLNDFRQRVNVDGPPDAAIPSKPRWSGMAMVLCAVALIILIVIGHLVWTVMRLSRS